MADQKKSWWKKLVSKLGFGGKNYAQGGSQASTSGTIGDGMADQTIRSVRKRNKALADASQ